MIKATIKSLLISLAFLLFVIVVGSLGGCESAADTYYPLEKTHTHGCPDSAQR